MGMAWRGITHCDRCFRPLGENEGELCKNCEQEKESDLRNYGSLSDSKEFEDLMRKIVQEELNKKEKKDYEIKRIGHLSLCYKTFLNRVANKDDIEIRMWNIDFTNSWVIASFEYNKDYNYYELNSCGDHLNDIFIDWRDFGELVKEGYEILNDFID